MAIRSVKVSDLDGSDGADVTIVVREHPAISSAKQLDVTAEQAEALVAKEVKNILSVEVEAKDGGRHEVFVSKADLDKWLGDPTKVLSAAAFTKGRPRGYSPNRTS